MLVFGYFELVKFGVACDCLHICSLHDVIIVPDNVSCFKGRNSFL